MKQKKWMKLLAVMFTIIFALGQMAGDGWNVSAAKRKSLNVKNVTLSVGMSKQLKVSGVKTGKVRWSSSKRSVASVSKKGKVKAKKPGKATITAKFAGGRLKCKVTVNARKNNVKPETSKVPAAQVTTKPSVNENVKPTAGAATKPVPGTTQKPVQTQVPTQIPTSIPTPVQSPAAQNSKILVAYFSWSGTSERIANNIISQTGADSFRIERAVPYSSDYQTTAYGDAMTEAQNNARPAIKDPLASVAQYDKIILCYPIWWHTAPMTVGTFLETYDLTGKKIYPVSQSASMDRSQYEESITFIKGCAKGAAVDEGIFSKDNTAIQTYVNRIINE